MISIVEQLPALLGVLLGAGSTYAVTSAADRARWRRQQSVRWDDRKVGAYADYAFALKKVISIAMRVAAYRGVHPDADVLSPDEGLPALAAAEEERTMRWEAVLLLGGEEVIVAARAWHNAVYRLERAASGLVIEMPWNEAVEAASLARRGFYQAARRDIGVAVDGAPEAYEWQISKLIAVASATPAGPEQSAEAPGQVPPGADGQERPGGALPATQPPHWGS